MPRRNPALRTAHLKEKHRKTRVSHSVIVGVVFLALLIGLFFLLRAPFMTIDTIRVSGAVAVSESALHVLAEDVLSGNYLGLIPKRNIIFYPRHTLENTILGKFSRIGSVYIFRKDTTMVVQVSERRPDALWCGTHQNERDLCSYVDEHGLVFGEAPNFSGAVFLAMYVEDQATATIPFQLLPETDYGNVRSFATKVSGILLKPISVYVNDQHDIFIRLSNGLEVWATLTRDLDKQFLALSTLLSDATLRKSFLASPRTIQYIDVRFGNKVFYR